MPTRKVVRDAGTGEFVKPSEATRRPKTTVTETIKVPKKNLESNQTEAPQGAFLRHFYG
ncbi:hypothetical protein [Sodalis sp. RH19]|uniref:hypothetical protein n=1 Tax=Sodalis sp. RH19 TaxID=3394334 RepID=UPI0039B3BDB3